MKEVYIPLPKPDFNYERPLSWSAISSFGWSKEQWYVKYCVHGECRREKDGEQAFCVITQCYNSQCPVVATSPEMIFGKEVGERLASDPTYLPEVPRLPIFEHELKLTFQGIPLVGYIDALCLDTFKLKEYKTGRKKWDQKRADEHGQINFYLLGLFLTKNIKPEKFSTYIHWMPTHIDDGRVAFIEPFCVRGFKASRTMADIMRFGQLIIDTRKEMIEYHKNHR